MSGRPPPPPSRSTIYPPLPPPSRSNGNPPSMIPPPPPSRSTNNPQPSLSTKVLPSFIPPPLKPPSRSNGNPPPPQSPSVSTQNPPPMIPPPQRTRPPPPPPVVPLSTEAGTELSITATNSEQEELLNTEGAMEQMVNNTTNAGNAASGQDGRKNKKGKKERVRKEDIGMNLNNRPPRPPPSRFTGIPPPLKPPPPPAVVQTPSSGTSQSSSSAVAGSSSDKAVLNEAESMQMKETQQDVKNKRKTKKAKGKMSKEDIRLPRKTWGFVPSEGFELKQLSPEMIQLLQSIGITPDDKIEFIPVLDAVMRESRGQGSPKPPPLPRGVRVPPPPSRRTGPAPPPPSRGMVPAPPPPSRVRVPPPPPTTRTDRDSKTGPDSGSDVRRPPPPPRRNTALPPSHTSPPLAVEDASRTGTGTGEDSGHDNLHEDDEQKMSDNRTSECVICLEAEAVVVFLECGHMVSCTDCAQKMENCPVCRATITRRLRVYKS